MDEKEKVSKMAKKKVTFDKDSCFHMNLSYAQFQELANIYYEGVEGSEADLILSLDANNVLEIQIAYKPRVFFVTECGKREEQIT